MTSCRDACPDTHRSPALERGLFESRARAQAAIAAGLVTADDVPVAKPSAIFPPSAVIRARRFPWVSRGGVKLAHALDRLRLRSVAAASASMSAPRPAASPRCCSRAARAASTRSMSAATSCTRACATGRRSCRSKAPTSASSTRRLGPTRPTSSPSTSASSRSSSCCRRRWRWRRRARNWSR